MELTGNFSLTLSIYNYKGSSLLLYFVFLVLLMSVGTFAFAQKITFENLVKLPE